MVRIKEKNRSSVYDTTDKVWNGERTCSNTYQTYKVDLPSRKINEDKRQAAAWRV